MSKIGALKLHEWTKVYKSEHIVTDGTILKCELCDYVLSVTQKQQKNVIVQHLKTAKHTGLVANCTASKQSFLMDALKKSESARSATKEFELELTQAFVQSGIPLHKINCTALKGFLEKYTMHHILDESTLGKNYVKPIYKGTIVKIKSIIGDSNVCFISDETTDVKQCAILNILVAPVAGKPVKPKTKLLKMYELEKTNNTKVMRSFNDACAFLWEGKIEYERVLLVVTDQAAYMLLAFSNLKAMFTKLNHVSCLAHCLHHICKAVCEEYSIANKFIRNMRKIMLKTLARIQVFKDTKNGLALPPDAIPTPWGSWINCGIYYCKNYGNIKNFLDALQDDATTVHRAKALIDNESLKDELFNIATYEFLPTAIEKLEMQGLAKEKQGKIVTDALQCMDGFAKEKLLASLNRNPDVKAFVENKDPEFRLQTAYAPLVSVDVERSFSLYKSILSDRRQNLTLDNIEMLNVLTFNEFLFA